MFVYGPSACSSTALTTPTKAGLKKAQYSNPTGFECGLLHVLCCRNHANNICNKPGSVLNSWLVGWYFGLETVPTITDESLNHTDYTAIPTNSTYY
jgi:hypothetical protein